METLANANNAQLRKFNFEYSFRPVYYFSRFAGLWPFSIIHDTNGKIQEIRFCFFDVLWSISVICLNLTLSFSTYKKLMSRREHRKNDIALVIFYVSKTTYLLIGVFGIVLDMFNRNKLVDILVKLNKFDNEVS